MAAPTVDFCTCRMCNGIRQNVANIDPAYDQTLHSNPRLGLSHSALLTRFTNDFQAYLKVVNLHKRSRIENAELRVRELELELRRIELEQQKARLTRRPARL
jgi:hypothetical protein